MPPSIVAVYRMSRLLADRLVVAAAEGQLSTAVTCVMGLTRAAAAIAEDVNRASEDEVRAAKCLQDELASLTGKVADAHAAGLVAEMVTRWFGPQGLPVSEVGEFEQLAATLRGPDPSA
ncbi:hypothetical protein [Limnoglobus roseus]|uniref:Uncharacterized protein n=1 Tax=Limnoglobus roseus TaxID=2598579 RepID=A0A5C1AR62_9BACT|nr:hypothetical protein [Limnoglobus roseus]QEL21105.1 hypothetical protein PX52LOC_08235 [Limnoglobus roseus]